MNGFTHKVQYYETLSKLAEDQEDGRRRGQCLILPKKFMNKSQARKILGLDGTEDEKEVWTRAEKIYRQKKAQVKMVVADNSLKSRTRKKYVDLDLWIRLFETETSEIESTNRRIDELLKKYAKEGF